MSTLFTIDFETNDLTQFDSVATDGGDLSVTAAAKMHGTYGMQALIDDANEIYGIVSITKSVTFRMRMYFDPNGVTIDDGDGFRLIYFQKAGGSYDNIFMLRLQYTTAGGYELNLRPLKDIDTTFGNDYCTITDAPHCVEIKIVRATDSGSVDGTAQWWVDGVDQGTMTAIDNFNQMGDYNWTLFVGAMGVSASGTSGTIFFDDIVANDDGSEIGQIVTAKPMVYYAQL